MDVTSTTSPALVFVVDLVNAWEAGVLSGLWVAGLWSTDRWPVRHVPAVALSAPEASDLAVSLGHLAVELGGVFRAPGSVEAAARVSALLAPHAVRLSVSTHDGHRPHLHFDDAGQDLAGRLRLNGLGALAGVLAASGDQHRLGGCAAAPCRRVFVDRSRSARQRFCSPACANRATVAAHRARRRLP